MTTETTCCDTCGRDFRAEGRLTEGGYPGERCFVPDSPDSPDCDFCGGEHVRCEEPRAFGSCVEEADWLDLESGSSYCAACQRPYRFEGHEDGVLFCTKAAAERHAGLVLILEEGWRPLIGRDGRERFAWKVYYAGPTECTTCGDLLSFEGDFGTCPSCGSQFRAEGEGGYGDDGQSFRWWRVDDEPIQDRDLVHYGKSEADN